MSDLQLEPLAALDETSARTLTRLMAPMLGIPLDPDWIETVVRNLTANAQVARLVLDFPLADELEPAAVFRL
ncbi:DUF4089 domain-containing protein [Chelatococcus reniformis]|uniref:DUF4089 domain-containing protein n=1 Tax=Chelatococcus reniformis TaxID=1494448 RepID=A0A916UIL5_9HYPH|nr:DUF4089 domain-containing protein [Chelatococcus reniformis]GGC74426.1 hypothetical protein GCM10010994_36090 [Chelatococcus reniformis]